MVLSEWCTMFANKTREMLTDKAVLNESYKRFFSLCSRHDADGDASILWER
jgi:hypothetical protein